jgi:NADH-quinone oxidoreductase subunit G
MCLVEVVGGPPKPAASCAMQVRDLRPGRNGEPPEIRTKTPMVKKAREGVMEFLLINHPLDCPICDQGGECDLQDQAMAYGVDFSRYREPKRAAIDLELGPLVGTHMTRCISCTRCVRFITEVAGVAELGQTGRGEDSEITNYLGKILESEMQGNIVDLCPVGALTNKPYAFTARPWELRKTESIDVMDALGSNIRVDVRGREVMRILPRNHDGVNEEWLADRSRYRLGRAAPAAARPALCAPGRQAEAGELGRGVRGDPRGGQGAGSDVAAVAGDLAPVEAMWALKQLWRRWGRIGWSAARTARSCRSAIAPGYAGTAAVEDIDSAGMILLVGANPRHAAPVLNARLRKAWLAGAEIGLIGAAADLTYSYAHMGDTPAALRDAADKGVSEATQEAASLIVVGQAALTRPDGAAVLAEAMRMAEVSNSRLMLLHSAASRVGGMDVGFAHPDGMACLDGAKLVFNLGADEVDMPEGAFVVYQGSHGDRGAHRADVILPGAAYTEQSGTFVNLEGRPQMANRAGFPPGEAKEDWAILRALSAELGQTLPFDSLAALRAKLYEAHPHLAAIDEVPANEWARVEAGGLEADVAFAPTTTDHYLTNPILRASEVMAELSRLAAERAQPMAAE